MRSGKRAFDFMAAAIGAICLFPAGAFIALAIRLGDGGPVFFRQTRVGRGGTHFRIWKFRTMVADAEHRGALLTVGNDPRVTRVGRWLRRLKLDELPQLLNVLRGDMSLVGPRPEVERYVALYTPEQRRVLDLVPGITDPASIRYRSEAELLAAAGNPERTYVDVVMPEKIRLNLEYASRATIWTDVRVILATLRHLRPSPSMNTGKAVLGRR